MATFRSIISWGILILIFTSIVSCNKKTEKVTCDKYEVIHAEMKYFDFDEVKGLTAFFIKGK